MHLFGGVWGRYTSPLLPPLLPSLLFFRTGLDSIKQSMSGIPPANTWRSPWWFGLPRGPEAITCQAFVAPYTALHTISLEIKLWHREGFKFAVFYDNWAQFCSATGSSVQWRFASWHSAEFDWQLSQSSVWNTGAWQCGREWDLCEAAVSEHQTAPIPAVLFPPVCRHRASASLKALGVLQGSSKPAESDFQLLRGPLMPPLPAETTALLSLGCLLQHTTSWEYWRREFWRF